MGHDDTTKALTRILPDLRIAPMTLGELEAALGTRIEGMTRRAVWSACERIRETLGVQLRVDRHGIRIESAEGLLQYAISNHRAAKRKINRARERAEAVDRRALTPSKAATCDRLIENLRVQQSRRVVAVDELDRRAQTQRDLDEARSSDAERRQREHALRRRRAG